MKKIPFFVKMLIIAAVFFIGTYVVNRASKGKGIKTTSKSGEVVLALDLKGMLVDQRRFFKNLRLYSQIDKIKAVLIRLDSPGGGVAVSQEIYHEFKRIKEELKKPVVISVGSIMASGALYASAGASHIVVNPGTLVGSIGVVFPMINMERLFDWAKVEPYSIKTGEFKDIGSRFRPMTAKERVLIQDLINSLLEQFKTALIEGRSLRPEDLEPYTDARVFTGETAVSAGFADSIGTYSDAIAVVGKLAGLGDKPRLFTPQPSYLERLSQRIEGVFKGSYSSSLENKALRGKATEWLSLFGVPSAGTPLYIFPPAIGIGL